ncbi:MAG: hybrid sensor histidine kinase/response regulator [Myxococcota bacterium]|nr:hybrid sensor histidine kinase/response regulator [Myxococcota bacterium]
MASRREPRLSPVDWLLLLTVTPVFLVVLGLHVDELSRTGAGGLPAYVVYQEGSPYPMVGGARGGGSSELQRGDRVISAGGVDVAGQGFFQFEATVLEAAGDGGRVPIVYERDGERRETSLDISGKGVLTFRLPALISLALVGLFVLVRSPRDVESRALFSAFMAMAIFELPFYGGPVWKTYAHYAVFYLVGQIAVFLLLRLVIAFPREMPEEKRAPQWLVGIGAIFWLSRIPYVTGYGLPPVWLPTWTIVSDIALFSTGLFVFAHNFRHSYPLGRRRAKFVLLGLAMPTVPMILALTAPALGLPPITHQVLFQTASLLGPALPLGILVSIQREGLLDIDRVLPAAAAYTLALITAVGASFAAVPLLGGVLAEALSVEASTGHLLVAVGLAMVAVPVGARLRPVFEGFFFPERATLERGFGALIRDLSDCDRGEEVLTLLQGRIRELLRLEHAALFQPTGQPVGQPTGDAFASGESAVRFASDGPLVRALERDPVPMTPSSRELAMRVPDLSVDEEEALASEAAAVLLPVRRGKDLAAFLLLGPKHSQDVFPGGELLLLGAAAEKASAELLRLRASAVAESERERAEELRGLKESAEAANRAKTRFLAAASHDLRQPLHALLLFVHRLAERAREGPDAELVGQIERSTEALADQFDTLLDLSRLEAGAVEAEPRVYDVGPELARLAVEWSEAAGAKGLALRFDPVEAQVESDPILLNRIVSNLLSNAVRYTERGEVHLRTEARDGRLAIEVADTGPGIPPARQQEVFGEFVQLGRRERSEGLGLGLSIVERTARLLGHEIEIESAPGRGSVFRVTVPMARTTRPGSVVEPAIRVPDLGRARVLVVDDDPSVVAAMGGLLASWGCDVIEAQSLAQALDALGDETPGERPFLIVADYHLGEGENGIDVIRAVRESMGHEVPAVVVSGEAKARTLGEIRASGHHYLPKPVPPAKLRALLSELLREQSGA